MSIRCRCYRFVLLVGFTTALGADVVSAQSQAALNTAPTITQVEVSSAGQHALVRVIGRGRLEFHALRLSNPERLALDFAGGRVGLPYPTISSAVSPVKRVRVGQFKPDVARVVIDLQQAVPFSVKPEGQSVTVVFAAFGGATAPPPGVRRTIPTSNSTESASARLARPSGGRPPEPEVASATQQVEPTNQNTVENGMLTFHAESRPVRSIVEQIAALANVAAVIPENLGQERITVNFQNYRVDEAIRQILKEYDAVFDYGVCEGSVGSSPLKAVWVYPANQGPALDRSLQAAWEAKSQRFEQGLADENPKARARAIDALIRREGRQSVELVLSALQDPSEKVRDQALYRALFMGVAVPEDTLVDLALKDASPDVRFLALQALPIDPRLKWIAERAAEDSSESVSNLARDILREYRKDLQSIGQAQP